MGTDAAGLYETPPRSCCDEAIHGHKGHVNIIYVNYALKRLIHVHCAFKKWLGHAMAYLVDKLYPTYR